MKCTDLGTQAPRAAVRFAPLALVVLGACVAPEGGSQRARLPDPTPGAMLIVPERPRALVATTNDEAIAAQRLADRHTASVELTGPGARRAPQETLAFLVETPEGRAFLSASGARAIARGRPAAQCPAVGVAALSGPGDAVARALGACLAALPHKRRGGCGCEVLAHDNVIAVSRGEFAYATGVSARLWAPGLGIDGLFVAEAAPDDGVVLRDLGGPFGRVTRTGDERVRVELDGAAPFEGTAQAIGYRRGRRAEVIRATDADGRLLNLLIGLEPDELAAQAGALPAASGG